MLNTYACNHGSIVLCRIGVRQEELYPLILWKRFRQWCLMGFFSRLCCVVFCFVLCCVICLLAELLIFFVLRFFIYFRVFQPRRRRCH